MTATSETITIPAVRRRASSGNKQTSDCLERGSFPSDFLQSRLPPDCGRSLHVSEVEIIKERTRHIEPAIKTATRLYESVQDLRVRCSAYGGVTVLGLWSQAISAICWSLGMSPASAAKRVQQLETTISKDIGELKKVVEQVIVPSLSGIRESFKGRTFQKSEDTPQSLLLVSVPLEKLGKVLAYDAFQRLVEERVKTSIWAEILRNESGRIVLVRTHGAVSEQLEFSYRRPGKVDVYINGQRKGSMWTDDAYALAKKFSVGGEIPLKRQKRFTEFAVC